MKAIVLAAGYATRLYPLTLNRPKALLEIAGRPILDHICDEIDTLDRADGIAVVSNDRFFAHFERWADERSQSGARCPITVLNDGSRTEGERLGAIGDLLFAIDQLRLDDEMLIVAGDNYFTWKLADLIAFYERVDADCVVVRKETDRRALRGLGVAELDGDGRVIGFEEKPQNPKSDFGVYATYIYKRDAIPLIRQYVREGNPSDAPGNLPAWLCERRRVMAWEFPGECYDIGTIESYEAARRLFDRRLFGQF